MLLRLISCFLSGVSDCARTDDRKCVGEMFVRPRNTYELSQLALTDSISYYVTSSIATDENDARAISAHCCGTHIVERGVLIS